jgi:hypothetical protein
VAIEIVLPDSARVEVTDMFRPSGRALNGLGDSVQAQLYWSSLDTTLTVLDSATGVSLATAVGTARLQARTGNLFSNPQTVSVLARLDSLRAAGATRDTVFVTPVPPDTAADSLSDSLRVQAYALGGIPANRRVVFALTIYPDTGSVVTLLPNDTVFTSSAGLAVTRVRLQGGPVPDSVVVTATMRHVNDTLVSDSLLTFVVEFRP